MEELVEVLVELVKMDPLVGKYVQKDSMGCSVRFVAVLLNFFGV